MIEVKASLKRNHFDLDVDLRLGERVTALFGPSGAGKSTILSIIAGIVAPTHGRVVIEGECLFDSKQNINIPIYKRRIGLVFQDGKLFPHLTVEENLSYALNLTFTDSRQFTYLQILELLELGRLLKQKPHQLSGGEKQRVAIGRALLSSPRLLMLDEPLASLDERLKKQILPFLKLVAEEISIPMIFISHSIEEVQQITSNIIYMQSGKIQIEENV
jgi:molybdate transport system ATP-binding protein